MTKTQTLGRPATVRGRPLTITLDELSRAFAAQLGNGNVSAGIRLALQQAMTPAPQPRLYPEPPAQQRAQPFPAPPYPPIPYPPGFDRE